MKQQVIVEQVDSSDSQPSRKEKLEKKRQIRKNKTQCLPTDLSQLRKIDTSTLSREQKAKIQKVKNRQAAQKSRDTHREYVASLEKEVKELREKVVTSRRCCWKCQRELEETSNHESSLSDQQTDERTKQEKVFSFEREDQLHLQDDSGIEHFNRFQEESFMRAQDSSEENSYMKLILFVCMVVVAVFLFTTGKPQPTPLPNSRALMEITESPEPIKIANNQEEMNMTKKLETAIVPVQKGLIALNTDDCLNSLMTVETIQVDPKKSLRTYHENQASQTYLAHQEGILLCSVRTPKPYQPSLSKIRSPLVKLYLLGSQIKEMLTNSNLLMPIRDSNIQLNGLYRVAAEIKDVNLVNDHNCLL